MSTPNALILWHEVYSSQVLTSACGQAQLLGNFTQGFMGIDHVLFTLCISAVH